MIDIDALHYELSGKRLLMQLEYLPDAVFPK